MRIQLIIPDELIHQVDVYCTSKGYTRSEFVRQLMRASLYESVTEKEVQETIDALAGTREANLGIVPQTATEHKLETFNRLKEQIEKQEDEQFKKYIDEPEPIYSKEDL